ncbi:MAG: glycosyltransferase family 39 protein [Armatimonadetes bacterium]|nr:glycosyltransferase family 39 protein [Armatimonadota bacterium]
MNRRPVSPCTWALTGLLAAQAVNLLLWLRVDQAGAPQVDSATQLRNALLFHQALTPPTPGSLLDCLQLHRNYPYPPLMYVLSVPFQWILGPSSDACALAGVTMYLLGLAAVYRLGARLWCERVGLAAAVVAGSGSVLLFQTEQLSLDSGVFALVAWLLVACVESDGGRHGGWIAGAGALCGLGMVCKTSFVVYGLAPLGWLAWRCLRARCEPHQVPEGRSLPCAAGESPAGHSLPCAAAELQSGHSLPCAAGEGWGGGSAPGPPSPESPPPASPRFAGGGDGVPDRASAEQTAAARAALLRALLLSAVIAAPWWVANLAAAGPKALWSATTDVIFPPPLWSFAGLTFYLGNLCTENLFPVVWLLFVVGFASQCRRGHDERQRVLLVFLVGGYALLTAIYNKTWRFTTPLTIPAALYACAWLDAQRWRKPGYAVLALLMLWQGWAAMWAPAASEPYQYRLWPRGLVMAKANPRTAEPWAPAAEQMAAMALREAERAARRPVRLAVAKPQNQFLSPLGLFYHLERAEALADPGRWPPRPWFDARSHNRWEYDLPDEELALDTLVIVQDAPRLAGLTGRLRSRPEWVEAGAVTLPDGTALVLFSRKDG